MKTCSRKTWWCLPILCAVVLVPETSAGEVVFSPYTATTVRPQREYEFFNPAFAYLEERDAFDFGARVPLGIAALFLVPERNPMLYLTDREQFDKRFDLFSFYDQLRYPASVLLNPTASPDEVVVRIEKDSIRVTTGDDRPLVFGRAAGASGISRPFTPLVPAPLIAYHFGRADFYSVTGLFLASTGHSLEPDRNLREVLEGEPVAPSTRYEFSAAASVAAGVSQSLSYRIETYPRDLRVIWAPRVVGYYRLFTAEARVNAGAETDEDTLLRTTDSEYSLFTSYPGNGWGGGMRLDFGMAFERDRVRAGASILNIVGLDTVTGTYIDGGTDDGPVTLTTVEPAPAVTVSASYRIPLTTGMLETSLDALASEALSAHAGVTLFRGPFMLGLTGGYKSGFEGSAIAGVRSGNRRVALSLTTHQSPFLRDVVWGLGLHVRVRR